MRNALTCAAVLALGVLGCREPTLVSSAGDVWTSEEAIDFGRTFIGYPRTGSVVLHNSARAARWASLSVGAGFALSSPSTLELAAGDSLEVSLRFDPLEPGMHHGTLRVEVEGESFELALTGTAEVPPQCSAEGPCTTSVFDPESGACALAIAPDQTSCTPESACLTNGVCVGGVCVGADTTCDDGDACTQDACDPGGGCVFIDVADQCPVPTDPCRVAACDPALGCTAVPAIDGTSCGAADCVTAHVCLAGACKALPVPEGSACGAATPCQERGVCSGGTCQQPSPGPTPIAWSHTPTDPMTGEFALLADADDNLYWTECKTLNCTGPGCGCALVSLTSTGAVRYREWMGSSVAPRVQLVLGNHVVSLIPGQGLLAQRTADGALEWMLPSGALPGGTSGGGTPPWVNLHDIAAANGQLFVSYTEETPTEKIIWVVGIDPATGVVDWSYDVEGTTAHLLADRFGNTHVRGLLWDAQQQTHVSHLWSLSPTGGLRWKDTQYTPALATSGGQLFTWTVAGLDANSGAKLWDHPAASLLWSIDGMIGPLGRGPWSWWLLPNAGIGAALMKVANADGSTRWQVPLTSWGQDFLVQPILTERDEVLIAAQDVEDTWSLTAIDGDGSALYQCELPAPGLSLRSPVLLENTLVMVRWDYPGVEIVAVHLPDTRASPTGWSGFRGNPQRTNSDR